MYWIPQAVHYTTTRNVRELQLGDAKRHAVLDYTTTRNVRELQLWVGLTSTPSHYTTTRNVRELQQKSQFPGPNHNYTTTRNVRELSDFQKGYVNTFYISNNILPVGSNRQTFSIRMRTLSPNWTVSVGIEQSVRAIGQNSQLFRWLGF